jgi:cytochrome c5
VVLISACSAGSGEGLDENGRPIGDSDGGNDGTTPEAAFAQIQSNVFDTACVTCHAGAGAPLGLRLDAANSFGLLVGVPSMQVPTLLRVEPGDADTSYLVQKLEGTASVGARMPLGAPAIPPDDIALIRQWITDGASPDSMTAPAIAGPIRITSLSPLPGSTLDRLPAMVIAMFDRELDATSVDSTTFILERSGGDGSFQEGNEQVLRAARVTVPAENPSIALLDTAGEPNLEDTYRVLLVGQAGANIRDLDSNALDGEFTGSFPSGDGNSGGDFMAPFVVAGLQPDIFSIQDLVFTPSCTECHSDLALGGPAAGLSLADADTSFHDLVGVPSQIEPALLRVSPGEPESSALLRVLDRDLVAGHPIAEPSVLDVISAWIAAGARW